MAQCRSIVFIAVFFAQHLYGQITLNGFGGYAEQNITKGYHYFFTGNFNRDTYTDLFCYAAAAPNLLTVAGGRGGELTTAKQSIFRNSISTPALWNKKQGNTASYIYTHRASGAVMVIATTQSGAASQRTLLTLSGYPDKILTSDITGDLKKEAIVCGPSFDGISVISSDGKENKIVRGKSYTRIAFVDFNSDGFPDVAAYSPLTQKLSLFYNNSRGAFKWVRDIGNYQSIVMLGSFDVNLDGYQDIVLLTGNTIEIITGDFTAAYDKELKLYLARSASKYLIGDYNRDGNTDFAVLTEKEQAVEIYFGLESGGFYEPLPYLENKNISDISNYYSKFVDGIAALNPDGKVYIVSRLRTFEDDTRFRLPGSPSQIGQFDAGNDGITDYYFFDKIHQRLSLLLRNKNGIPAVYYSVKTGKEFSRIRVYDALPNQKYFLLFNRNDHLIQVTGVTLGETYSYAREHYYTGGDVFDARFLRSEKNERPSLEIVYHIKNAAYVSLLEYENGQYTPTGVTYIDQKVLNALIDQQQNIYYFTSKADSFLLNRFSSKTNAISRIKAFARQQVLAGRMLLVSPTNPEQQYVMVHYRENGVAEQKKMNKMLSQEEEGKFLISDGKYSSVYKNLRLSLAWDANEPLRLSEYYYGNQTLLFTYFKGSGVFYRVQFRKAEKNFILKPMAVFDDIQAFTVSSLRMRNFYATVLMKNDGLLRFKKIEAL